MNNDSSNFDYARETKNFREFLEFLFVHKFRYAISFLMHFHNALFVERNESGNSILNQFLIYDSLLCYKYFNLNENCEMNIFFENDIKLFCNCLIDSLDQKKKKECFKLFFFIINQTPEKKYLQLISENLKIKYKEGTTTQREISIFLLKELFNSQFMSIKIVMMELIQTFLQNDFDEILNYKPFEEKVNLIFLIETIKSILQYFLEILKDKYKNVLIQANFLEILLSHNFDKYKNNAIALSAMICLLCDIFEGHYIFEDLTNEYANEKFCVVLEAKPEENNFQILSHNGSLTTLQFNFKILESKDDDLLKLHFNSIQWDDIKLQFKKLFFFKKSKPLLEAFSESINVTDNLKLMQSFKCLSNYKFIQ